MKLLATTDHYKVIEPLRRVSFNHLFARSVVENKVSGKVFVDNPGDPKTFYVVHPYGMSLLFGANDNASFNNSLKAHALNVYDNRTTHEWMQAFPDNWDATLRELFKDCSIRSSENRAGTGKGIIEWNTRVNFKFNTTRYKNIQRPVVSSGITIVRTDRQIFRDMKGAVVPAHFWKDEDDFIRNGAGFSLLDNGQLAATAYSAFINEEQLEIGIETVERFRGNGYAALVSLALIDFCMEKGLEPVWACRLENTGSYRLAQKVGFDPVLEIPYYRLSN